MGKNRTNSHFSFAASSLVFGIGVTLILLASCGDPEALVDSIVGQVTVAAAPTYSLTMQEDALSSVTPKGTVTVKKDVAQSISAEPVTGYHFVQWTVVEGDGVLFADDTSSITTVTLTTEDATILAHCEPDIYTLTIGDDGNGSATPTGEIQVEHGVPKNISAEADPGWDFSTWYLVTGTGVSFDPANIATTTITLTQGDVTIEARFTQFSYTLTMDNDTNGYTTPAKGDAPVAHGADTPIAAYPNDGYHFLSWTEEPDLGNADIADAGAFSTTVALTGPATVKANFEIDTYALTIDKVGEGVLVVGGITDPVDPVDADYDEPITLVATPATGYDFDGWTAEVNLENVTFSNPGSETNASVRLEGDATIQANFGPEPYDLTVTSGTGGTTIPVSDSTVTAYFDLPTAIEAIPDTASGYKFFEWQVTGAGSSFGANGNAASTTIILTEPVTVQAVFALEEYELTLESALNGSITSPVTIVGEGSDTYTVTHGISTDLRATPLPGYELSWAVLSGDAIITDPISETLASIECTGPATIMANFSLIPANIAISQGLDDIANGTGQYDFENVVNDGAGNYSASPVVTFTITNDGGEEDSFTVNGVTFVAGADNDNFILTPPGGLPAALAYGATLDFTVQFDPLASGALSATVQIDSTAPNASVFDFDVIGTGDDFTIEMMPVNTTVTTNLELGTGTDIEGAITPAFVQLSPYTMGKYEITYREWSIVKTWAEAQDPVYTFNDLESKGDSGLGSDLQPVTNVSWTDAIAWCNALSEMTGNTVYYYNDTGRGTNDVYRDATTPVASAQITNTGNNSNECVDLTATGYRLPTEAEWEYAARYDDGDL